MKILQRTGTLRTQIYTSCCVLVALCVLNMGIGWWGQYRLLQNFDSYEQTERTAAAVLKIDRNVQELKSRSENYLHTGSESQHQTAVQFQLDLLQQIDSVMQETNSEDLRTILAEMRTHVQTLQEQLRLAAEERDLRKNLVQEQLPIIGDQVQAAVRRFQATLGENASDASHDHLLDAIQAFSFARMNLLQYFNNPRSEDFDRMVQSLKEAEHLTASIVSSSTSPEFTLAQADLLAKLAQFRQIGSHAVHATRSYLYYSNVVMAGEISEFVYYSNRLKSFVVDQQKLNRQSRRASAQQTRNLGFAASSIAILLAICLAARLSYSIVSPIAQITETFRQLSGGATIDAIPATHRHDEIGRMAQAATIFNEKNRETRRLLQHSRELSAELAIKAQALEESNQELDNFAYVASHDLKSPLRGLNALATWVQEDCDSLLPAGSRKHLQQMQDRVARMEALLDDLLEYSRAGRSEVSIENVNVGELLDSVLQIVDNPGEVQIRVQGNLPELPTYRAPLQQIFLNLITNAVKYNDKGTEGVVEIECHEIDQAYRFTISDNGIGIDPKFHERIFRMYQRVAVKKADGSGMGLAIVKKQVETYGGEVSVFSCAGQGAKFTFTWPKGLSCPTAVQPRSPQLTA
ncbi:sensor histidine kinase [Rosistilla oblonga]|uniref:sensor histidine kinase n=1 Tax=Rosistilla oblonga TaxID=2527990 RepID=UPI003A96EF9E